MQGSVAEFEEDGVSIFCSGLHDDLTTLTLPVKKMKSKGSFKSSATFLSASRDGSDGPRVEIFGYEIEQEFACGGQTFGEFENARIACRNDLDRRIEEQRQSR